MQKKDIPSRLLFGSFVFAAISLFLFSYTQVDLNLTLSRVSIFQTIEKSFQYIGYFKRPLATSLYVGILGVFYILYWYILHEIHKGKISEKFLWKIIIFISLILLFSYPAFSYDFFNYMFTAKTVLVYHKNPYEVIPLQFSGIEPWLTFMRWTHLPSAYTPLWILMTLPAYLFGFGFFLLTLFNIKILVIGFYLLTVWAIGKILEIEDEKRKILGMAIFALNPLIIIESLVSSHNDIVMMGFAMTSIVLYMQQKKLRSFLLLAASVALKLMTIFLIPVYFLRWNRLYAFIAILVGFLFVCSQREVLPWYWVWVMPFVALLPKRKNITIIATFVSLGLLLRYAPYLYYGHWDAPVPTIKFWVTLMPVVVSLCFLLIFRLKDRRSKITSN